MFDHIRFTKSFEHLDISSSYIRDNAEKIPSGVSVHSFRDSEFHINGTVRSIGAIPMSAESRKRFMYIQEFSYMNADKDYYARHRYYESYQLLYTYSGKAEAAYDGKHYVMEKGTAFLFDCTKKRSYRTTGDHWESSDLHFLGGHSDYLYHNFFENAPPQFQVPDETCFQGLLENILKCHTEVSVYREWHVSSGLDDILGYLFAMSSNTGNNVPEWLQYLITYIEHNFRNPLTLDSLASFSGLSKYHLSHEFKKYTGYSPLQYITELRIQEAKTLLKMTSIPSYKIGSLAGIPNEANFIRIFKEKTGVTPGEFRG